MEALLGRRVFTIEVSDDQSILAFRTDGGPVAFKAWGDCCSESWFADITGVDALLGGLVAEVQVVSMDGYNVEDGRGRQDFDEAYGYKIRTEKGWASVVFRNSSNGYYGGELELHEGEWPEGMAGITDDWSA